MRAKPIGILTVLAAVTAMAGCGGAGGAADAPPPARADSPAGAADAAGDVPVTVKTFSFQPDPVETDAGGTVTWTNRDSTVHTVTSGTRARPDGRFDDQLAEASGTSSHTFDEPGTYRYFCSRHSGPGMEGVVVVR